MVSLYNYMFLLQVQKFIIVQILQSQGHRERDVAEVVPPNFGMLQQSKVLIVELDAACLL